MNIDTRYSLAVIVLALLGAGCADEAQLARQKAAFQLLDKAADTSPAAAAATREAPLECWYLVPAGTVAPKFICFTADQDPPAAAKDDDPVECERGKRHIWRCSTASDKALVQQEKMASYGEY